MSKLDITDTKSGEAACGTVPALEAVKGPPGYGRALSIALNDPDTIGAALRTYIKAPLLPVSPPTLDQAIVDGKLDALLSTDNHTLTHHMGRFGKAIVEGLPPEELLAISHSASNHGHHTFALRILKDVLIAHKEFSKDPANLHLISAVRVSVLERMLPCADTLTTCRELAWKDGPKVTPEELKALTGLVAGAHVKLDTKSFLDLAVSAGEIGPTIFGTPEVKDLVRSARLELIKLISADSDTLMIDIRRVTSQLPNFNSVLANAFLERLPTIPKGPESKPFPPQFRLEIARMMEQIFPGYLNDAEPRVELNEIRAALLSASVAGGPVGCMTLGKLFEKMALRQSDVTPVLRAVRDPDPVTRALTVCDIYRSLGWLLGGKEFDADIGLVEARLDIINALPAAGIRRGALLEAITQNLPPFTDDEQELLDSKT